MKNLIILYENCEFWQEKVELLHPFCPLSKGCLGFLFFLKDLETEDEKSNILHTNALMFLCQTFYSQRSASLFPLKSYLCFSSFQRMKGSNISFYRKNYSQRICLHLKKTCKILYLQDIKPARPLQIIRFFFSNF